VNIEALQPRLHPFIVVVAAAAAAAAAAVSFPDTTRAAMYEMVDIALVT